MAAALATCRCDGVVAQAVPHWRCCVGVAVRYVTLIFVFGALVLSIAGVGSSNWVRVQSNDDTKFEFGLVHMCRTLNDGVDGLCCVGTWTACAARDLWLPSCVHRWHACRCVSVSGTVYVSGRRVWRRVAVPGRPLLPSCCVSCVIVCCAPVAGGLVIGGRAAVTLGHKPPPSI